MEQIQDDWNALSDDQEIKIMERFAKSGRMYIYVFVGRKWKPETAICMAKLNKLNIMPVISEFLIISYRVSLSEPVILGIVYPAAVAFIAVSLLPDILDAVAPLNESRIRMLPFMAEYFLDQETYFYPLLFHMDLSLIAGITTAIATETLLFAYVYHICAMFQITR